MAPRAHYAQLKQAGAVMAPKIINGYGTITYANGRTYTGEWKAGKLNGQGTYTFDGDMYAGAFKAGRPAP